MAGRKSDTEKPTPSPKKSEDFLSLMKGNFTVAQFIQIVSQSGVPADDARALCNSFRKL